MNSYRFPDPIHGTIEIPPWLRTIQDSEPIRRMMFIRQLGLKAYIDFPGAIHTRYGHVLGTMHLASKLINTLIKKEDRAEIKSNLRSNKDTLMAAAFLHDVGHGPFSHAVDYVLKSVLKKNHEEISEDIIKKNLDSIEDYGIATDQVIKIINGKHSHNFISHVITSQIDVDKLDYLLRDAHNIGYRYSFDLDHFLSFYTVIGDPRDLRGCILGLEKSNEAIVTTQIFTLIWSGMYDLVYHIQSSRIAEKMLEKAVLYACKKSDSTITAYFSKIEEYIRLYDDMLLDGLERINGFPRDIATWIKKGTLYKPIKPINGMELKDPSLLTIISEDPEEISEELTVKLCNQMQIDEYNIICDIIKTKTPKDIFLNQKDNSGEPIEIREASTVIGTMKSKLYINAYIKPEVKIEENKLKTKILQIITELK